MKKPTVGLYLIVKDEVEQVKELLKQAYPYFDAIYVTVSDEKAFNRLKDAGDKVIVDHRPWNDRFDDARNHNFAQGKTDYNFWLDADDSFDFSVIPQLMKRVVDEGLDVIWLPYEYAYDQNGNCVARHTRERLISRHKGFTWRGWVHETLISDGIYKRADDIYPVRHTNSDPKHSSQRNLDILEKAYKETSDPRYVHYLGITYFTEGRYQEAIDTLLEYIEVGGWDEEIYRSLLRISDSYNQLDKVEEAIQFALKATSVMPDYPDAFFTLAQIEFADENYKQCLEWLKVAFGKQRPDSPSITDPTIPDRARFIGAISEFQMKNYGEALKLLQTVKTMDISDLLPHYESQANADSLANILPQILDFYKDPLPLWNNLPEALKYDNRFRKLRNSVTEPKVWDKKSVVIFCGKGYEEWGPHTLNKGMGGSEEAIVYLSRELAKQGYAVTVYGEVEKPYVDPVAGEYGGVNWLPWQMIDTRDQFDTLILWRYPNLAGQFKANRLLIDMHDLLPKKQVMPIKNATYMFKSQWHKDQYPNITNYNIVSNGVVLDQFNKKVKKNPNSVGYFSAYYRGLEHLVKLWPRIKEQVPEAELNIYYGWESWTSFQGEDEFYKRMTAMLEDAKAIGVTEHGRVSHAELADKMLATNVWAYPTEFPEINCITALKANAAGMKPVITDRAALKETGGPNAYSLETDLFYTDEYNQDKFVKAIVDALKSPQTDKEIERQKKWAKQFEWAEIAKQWKGAINAK